MESVLLQLGGKGGFQFKVTAAAYNTLTREHSYRWASQARFGNHNALQYTGKDATSISLEGEIAVMYRNVGPHQLEALVAMADRGMPYLLTSGTGAILGYYCIKSVSESQRKIAAKGLPRLQSFSLELEYYGNTL